uniref:Uncharacterized protein n=1 Tax=Arundo donax TaxID=35708 RepID=A0A0A9BGF0_ARUDO
MGNGCYNWPSNWGLLSTAGQTISTSVS